MAASVVSSGISFTEASMSTPAEHLEDDLLNIPGVGESAGGNTEIRRIPYVTLEVKKDNNTTVTHMCLVSEAQILVRIHGREHVKLIPNDMETMGTQHREVNEAGEYARLEALYKEDEMGQSFCSHVYGPVFSGRLDALLQRYHTDKADIPSRAQVANEQAAAEEAQRRADRQAEHALRAQERAEARAHQTNKAVQRFEAPMSGMPQDIEDIERETFEHLANKQQVMEWLSSQGLVFRPTSSAQALRRHVEQVQELSELGVEIERGTNVTDLDMILQQAHQAVGGAIEDAEDAQSLLDESNEGF